MKNILMISSILMFAMSSNLYAMKTNCEKVPEGLELAKSLENKMYNQSEVLMQTFQLEVKNYRETCDSSQDMFEQTQISILIEMNWLI